MSILDNLPHTCRRLRRTRTLDEYGGAYDTITQVGDWLSCWRQLTNDREVNEYAKRGISITNKVYFTQDPEVDASYVLEMEGRWFEVRSVSTPDASVGLGIVWRVMCEETSVGTTNLPQSSNPQDVVNGQLIDENSSSSSSSSDSSSSSLSASSASSGP